MIRTCISALLVVALAGCATARSRRGTSPEEVQIQRWEDARSLGDGKLLGLAAHGQSPSVRSRALLALGAIQDPATAGAIAAALADPSPEVRDSAALATGLLGLSWEKLPEAVRDRLLDAVITADGAGTGDRREYVDAVARLGGPRATEYLLGLVDGPDLARAARAAIGLGAVARREQQGDEKVVARLLARLSAAFDDAQPRELRWALAYGLAFTRSPNARGAMVHCAGVAGEPELNAICARGLLDTACLADIPALRALLRHPDPRVASEAVRVLARLAGTDEGASAAIDALGDLAAKVDRVAAGEGKEAHPLLQLAQSGLPAPGQALLASFRLKVQAAMPGASAVGRKDLANLDCRFAAARDRLRAEVKEVLSCGGGLIPEARRIRLALSQVESIPEDARADRAAAFAAYLSHPELTVRSAAVSALVATRAPGVAEKLRPLLQSEDEILAAGVAAALATLHDAPSGPALLALAGRVPSDPGAADSIAAALADLQVPGAEGVLQAWLQGPRAHGRLAAAKALRKLRAAPVEVPRDEPPPELPPAPPPGATLTFRTEKGSVVVRLDTEATPLTSANLYRLAKRGYFDGLTFHRVVPDFVVQGGDPRGDGEGGPGYSIRCESSDRRYLRGTVGMALSGKDTGGSQFFFTLSEQPHLEGRYTAFGEVVAGMDVVDRLLEGDVMTQVVAAP